MSRTTRRLVAAGLAGIVVIVVVIATRDDGPTAIVHVPIDRGEPDFEDRFEGQTLDASRWVTCHWWAADGCTIESNNELERYRASQVEVAGGALRLVADRAVSDDNDGSPFVSGMVSTGRIRDRDPEHRFVFRYGYVEARVQLPSGDGFWPAVWLLPADLESKPEIDVLEVLGHEPELARFHVHFADEVLGSSFSGLGAGWHTVALDWRPGQLTWLIDGVPRWQVNDERVPAEPMYLIFNLAVGGDYPGAPTDDTPFPAEMLVDRVRIWSGAA